MAPSLSSEINDLQELLMGELVPPSQGFGKGAPRRSSAPKHLHPGLIHARFRHAGTQSSPCPTAKSLLEDDRDGAPRGDRASPRHRRLRLRLFIALSVQ